MVDEYLLEHIVLHVTANNNIVPAVDNKYLHSNV